MGHINQRAPNNRVAEDSGQLELGRDAYDRRSWDDAYRWLSLADEAVQLGVEDLERLAMSACLTGREEEYLRGLERAHRAYLDSGARHGRPRPRVRRRMLRPGRIRQRLDDMVRERARGGSSATLTNRINIGIGIK
ncbi:MAG TPA: hypothetical protein VE175_05545 [Woeseiaceae bacterium]|nr:hypothetical protein [Woeseiaceae bacterium]